MGFDMQIETLADDDGYFRLNVWGMGECRQLMFNLGMAYEAPEKCIPPWPELADFGLTEYPDDPADDTSGFTQACDDVLRWMAPDHPGIPLHKLGSNDGWLVTPLECKGAIALWNKARDNGASEPPVDWWSRWLEYLRRAADNGGFRVY